MPSIKKKFSLVGAEIEEYFGKPDVWRGWPETAGKLNRPIREKKAAALVHSDNTDETHHMYRSRLKCYNKHYVLRINTSTDLCATTPSPPSFLHLEKRNCKYHSFTRLPTVSWLQLEHFWKYFGKARAVISPPNDTHLQYKMGSC